MAKREKTSGRAVFYKPITDAEEIRCGYFLKSPPRMALKLEWKKRYFVLFKTSDQNYQLRYFRSAEEKGQALGGIDLTQISLIYGNPQHHQKWIWVEKTFKCSPSCVLYIRAGNRDYFLVGETSTEVDGWFNDLCKAMENRPHKYLSKEEISNGQPVVDIITKPLQRRKYSAPEIKAPFIAKAEEDKNNDCNDPLQHALLKTRSVSDPSPNEMEGNTQKEQITSKRPVSEPLRLVYNEDYDYPRSFLKPESEGNSVTQEPCTESLYETMSKFKITRDTPAANNREVEQICNGTLMRSINEVFDKFVAKSPPPFPISEEAPFEDGEDKRHSDFSSSSSCANSPVDFTNGQDKQDNSESTPEERAFMVMQSDLKKHLTLTDVEGKPSVSNWTGQPQSVCLFHKGDQVLAINDLHTSTVEEVNMFVGKSLKNELKVTILRQRGRQPLHLPNSPCSD